MLRVLIKIIIHKEGGKKLLEVMNIFILECHKLHQVVYVCTTFFFVYHISMKCCFFLNKKQSQRIEKEKVNIVCKPLWSLLSSYVAPKIRPQLSHAPCNLGPSQSAACDALLCSTDRQQGPAGPSVSTQPGQCPPVQSSTTSLSAYTADIVLRAARQGPICPLGWFWS